MPVRSGSGPGGSLSREPALVLEGRVAHRMAGLLTDEDAFSLASQWRVPSRILTGFPILPAAEFRGHTRGTMRHLFD